MTCHHRPQQLRGPGPTAHPGVLAGSVLPFGFCGVELALATLAADDREFDFRLAQRAGGIFVVVAQRLGRLSGGGQFGSDRVGRRGSQLSCQLGGPPLRGLRRRMCGLRRRRQVLIADRRPLLGQTAGGRIQLDALSRRFVQQNRCPRGCLGERATGGRRGPTTSFAFGLCGDPSCLRRIEFGAGRGDVQREIWLSGLTGTQLS